MGGFFYFVNGRLNLIFVEVLALIDKNRRLVFHFT